MRWRARLGLRARIALAVVLVTTTATAAMALAAYRLQADQARDRFVAAATAGIRSDLTQARNRLVSVEGEVNRIEVVALYMRDRLGLGWSVFDLDADLPGQPEVPPGQVLPGGGTVAAPLDETLVDRGGSAEITVGGTPMLVLTGEVVPGLVLAEYYSLARLEGDLARLRWVLTLIALGVAALGVPAATVAARRIQRPVREVARAARELGDGTLETRVPVQGRDELADLSRAFNAMAVRVGESIEQLRDKDRQQRRFVADVAHDLRTPVAAMVAAADGLEHAGTGSPARSARLLGAQSRRLARLVDDLLEISRFDAGVAELLPERVRLGELAAEAADLVASGADVTVRASGDDEVTGDPRRLLTIVRNLLANAVRHGAEPITVTVDGSAPDTVTLRVADSGAGVPEELLPVLFDRFVRADRSRRYTEGSGLGLAIARENALAHGGHLEVHNDGGAVFTLTVPRGSGWEERG
ncbi:two-component system sensor histidine kinase MtrB [Prauserella shujinwangii]|uniref:Signal transduction histidine-protein kinase/phosphatase MprB n=1 Tax=Prauserella shujinwangii TaxID=1453103 RepID=A0A2T0LZG6_9PSEU|nr:HAMP domain-containing sensor histidine kinase [Prauserella shujinwangii]PRX49515.1 two-component system sensor histidine kinase MtrB [Prauserella shujinwangii]